MEYQIKQSYTNHYGVDLKNTDLTRNINFASDMRNAQYKQSGSPEKRRGNQVVAASAGGIGAFEYQRWNPSTGADDSRKLVIDSTLKEIKKSTLTVTYSGAAVYCALSVYVDASVPEYKLKIDEASTVVLSMSLGQGYDEVSTVDLSDVVTAINALTGFTASVSGPDTVPAAFLNIVRDYDLTSSAYVGNAEYTQAVTSMVASPFAAAWANRNEDDFENVSSVVMENKIYFAHADTEVYKYDGLILSKAGIPEPADPTSAVGIAGTITGNNYYHQQQFILEDNAGQFVESNLSRTATGLSVTNKHIDVTVNNLLGNLGYNALGAIVNGAQAGVNTITVDDGSGGNHTLVVGCKAYFYDGVSASYVTRNVTAVTSTTITIDGAAVNVADNVVISNNLKIAIWRNKTSAVTPSTFYLVAEIPNNPFTATQTFEDSLADSSLGALLDPPAFDRSPPKRGKYISQWDGVMLTAGAKDSPSLVCYSSDEGAEYFPADSNEIIYGTAAGDPIRGMGANNEVFAIMGLNSFGVLTGDIRSNALRLEIKSEDIGCAAHATIKEVNGALAWMSPKGPRLSAGGQVPRPLGEAIDADGRPSGASRIDPEFEKGSGRVASEVFNLRRCVAVHDRKEDKYLLFVPATSTLGGENVTNNNSRVYAYDYIRDAWLIWDNLDFMGGAFLTAQTEQLYFVENRYSTYSGTVRHLISKRHGLGDAWDYADNLLPVGGSDAQAWEYVTQWEPLGAPSVLKRFTKLKVFTLEEVANNSFTIDVHTEANYQRDLTVAEFTMSFAVGGYGVSEYGSTQYGDPSIGSSTHSLPRDRTKAIRLRFKNGQIHQNVILSGWELECVTPYRMGIKP